MDKKLGEKNPREVYKERLSLLNDEQLKQEWDIITDNAYDYAAFPQNFADLKHEMAMRFMKEARNQPEQREAKAYFWDKLLKSAEEFSLLVAKQEWFGAKYLYDRASMLTAFLETPMELRQKLFGYTTDDGLNIDGLFCKKDVNKVMNECLLKNRLGYECIVYRIPGEIGYYGAKADPGTYKMRKEDNPAYIQEVSGH